jgi:hypothetical protein
LNLTPIGLLDGLVIAATSLLPLLANEATKTMSSRAAEDDTDLEAAAISQ